MIRATFLKLLLAATAAVLLLSAVGTAADGVVCQLTVSQTSAESDRHVLITDTITCVVDIPVSGYVAGFSAEIEVTALDSNKCDLIAHIVTIGPQSTTLTRKFTVEYELPAVINGIPTKSADRLTLEIRPLAPTTVDLQYCPYNHRAQGQFETRPSANVDFHFVAGSFADYYWSTVKSIFEEEYRRIASMLAFSLPGKYSVYLSPCYMPSVWWDRQFASMVDPTRSAAMGLYGHQAMGADPFILNSCAIQRNMGYSHPLLIDGTANFFAPSILDLREILQNDPSPMLSRFAEPLEYRTGDPFLVDRVSSSFVKFFLASYGPQAFKELYRNSHDLNLLQQLEDISHRSIDNLENEFRLYVDSVTMDIGTLRRYAQRAEAMFAYGEALKQYRRMYDRCERPDDSLRILGDLQRAYYLTGDYFNAAAMAAREIKRDSATALDYMALGSYQLMAGQPDNAIANFDRAVALDSASALIAFNRGIYFYTQDRLQRAREALESIVTESTGSSAQAEGRALLGLVLLATDNDADSQLAMSYFQQAQSILNSALSADPSRGDLYCWMGISYAATGELDAAREFLQIAYFLETRPYYLGMTNLWLGKLADIEGDHDTAKEYYDLVINQPSAAYHQEEARKLIQTPFTWKSLP